MKIKLQPHQTLVLRTCRADGTSHNRFPWPKTGRVKCPDWSPVKVCGNGLHGALMGKGNGGLFYGDIDALWQIVRVNKNTIVDLGDKVKFPYGYVVFTGTQKEVSEILLENGFKEYIGKITPIRNKKLISITNDCGISNSYNISVSGIRGVSCSDEVSIIDFENSIGISTRIVISLSMGYNILIGASRCSILHPRNYNYVFGKVGTKIIIDGLVFTIDGSTLKADTYYKVKYISHSYKLVEVSKHENSNLSMLISKLDGLRKDNIIDL